MTDIDWHTEVTKLREELAHERSLTRVYAEREAALEEQLGRYLARAQRAEAKVAELEEEVASLVREKARAAGGPTRPFGINVFKEDS